MRPQAEDRKSRTAILIKSNVEYKALEHEIRGAEGDSVWRIGIGIDEPWRR
jgi:hypothetical protein